MVLGERVGGGGGGLDKKGGLVKEVVLGERVGGG